MKMTNSHNFVLAMMSVGACAVTAVIAQVGPGPVCLTTKFLRKACDNLAKESSPECNDVILQNDNVFDTEDTPGCGNK